MDIYLAPYSGADREHASGGLASEHEHIDVTELGLDRLTREGPRPRHRPNRKFQTVGEQMVPATALIILKRKCRSLSFDKNLRL
jgi:hypothetical protein